MYYKVVDTNLRSCIHGDSKIGVRYLTGVWIQPSIVGSKLMCFSNLDSAKLFRNSHGGYIYECEVSNPSHRGPFVYVGNLNSDTVCDKLLKMLSTEFIGSYYDCAPENTVFCDAIKLLDMVVK